tara:strand:+ start:214218 stop:214940 length:723 start_codon:yes stop_codon:yes gene_type:complete
MLNIQAIGDISSEYKGLVKKAFLNHGFNLEFKQINQIVDALTISFDKQSSKVLTQNKIKFYNWDLLFSVLGPSDKHGDLEKKLNERIKVLKSIISLKSRPLADEVHASIRVKDLAKSSQFYTWLYGVEPKEWTHRYVTFVRSDIKLNFVLLVSDGKELHQDTLYHLGMGVKSKSDVLSFYYSALENGFHIEKIPRTTWRGTPLHELWLKDPDGTLVEIYARLSSEELKEMPEDKEPVDLI